MLEWARDADPSQLMRVIGKLSRDDVSRECTYDVLDFLRDLGMYAELKHCQERLLRAEKAWFECTMLLGLQAPISRIRETLGELLIKTGEGTYPMSL
ncbi:hypothetical protein Forpe1208_v001255 [Fusarium oxysporum f. sp. rapae]|uniref:Uncharacterized protein n=1 Tax=Fusarium oxysporum f. sp. rapae TaxID=485398 RepID=A0A8J5PKM5_FUSOX|nr:hypothetical protein Forpe1208_v001255 [Fusarium oxysporum f. sp. rapae]